MPLLRSYPDVFASVYKHAAPTEQFPNRLLRNPDSGLVRFVLVIQQSNKAYDRSKNTPVGHEAQGYKHISNSFQVYWIFIGLHPLPRKYPCYRRTFAEVLGPCNCTTSDFFTRGFSKFAIPQIHRDEVLVLQRDIDHLGFLPLRFKTLRVRFRWEQYAA
jgi:hypothetical protein